jgi:hypothetical protein
MHAHGYDHKAFPSAEQWSDVMRIVFPPLPSAEQWSDLQPDVFPHLTSAEQWSDLQPHVLRPLPSAEQWSDLQWSTLQPPAVLPSMEPDNGCRGWSHTTGAMSEWMWRTTQPWVPNPNYPLDPRPERPPYPQKRTLATALADGLGFVPIEPAPIEWIATKLAKKGQLSHLLERHIVDGVEFYSDGRRVYNSMKSCPFDPMAGRADGSKKPSFKKAYAFHRRANACAGEREKVVVAEAVEVKRLAYNAKKRAEYAAAKGSAVGVCK